MSDQAIVAIATFLAGTGLTGIGLLIRMFMDVKAVKASVAMVPELERRVGSLIEWKVKMDAQAPLLSQANEKEHQIMQKDIAHQETKMDLLTSKIDNMALEFQLLRKEMSK